MILGRGGRPDPIDFSQMISLSPAESLGPGPRQGRGPGPNQTLSQTLHETAIYAAPLAPTSTTPGLIGSPMAVPSVASGYVGFLPGFLRVIVQSYGPSRALRFAPREQGLGAWTVGRRGRHSWDWKIDLHWGGFRGQCWGLLWFIISLHYIGYMECLGLLFLRSFWRTTCRFSA